MGVTGAWGIKAEEGTGGWGSLRKADERQEKERKRVEEGGRGIEEDGEMGKRKGRKMNTRGVRMIRKREGGGGREVIQ